MRIRDKIVNFVLCHFQRFVIYLPTARERNVFTCVCDSVHNWPHGYSVTPCYGTVGTHPTGMLSCYKKSFYFETDIERNLRFCP